MFKNIKGIIALTVLLVAFFTNAYSVSIGPWDITELEEVPSWKTTTVDAESGMTGILYESIDYLGNTVEVFAYYSAPTGTMPSGGWPAAIFCHGGGGTAFPEAVEYWNAQGYAAISMDLEGDYPSGEATPNPGPSRDGVWDDYSLPIEEQWYYHAIAQVLKAHSLIASFPEVDASKIGVLGSSWGGTITSTVMGVDSRVAWSIPVYGAGFLSESDGHQGDAIAAGDETEFVNTYYDGSVYFNNVTSPTLWLNGINDYHFSLSCNQLSSQAVQGPTTLMFLDDFPHGHLTWTRRDECFVFANSVVNGGVALPEVGKPYISSNTAYVTASSDVGMSSGQLFYSYDDDDVDLNDKVWAYLDASVSDNTISASIPEGASIILFTATDSRGYMVTSEYLLTSEITTTPTEGNLALNGTASQSSTSYSAYASRAIDGNTSGLWDDGSVMHTDNEANAWWQVNLGTTYDIGDIVIYNRTDDCCIARLSNFTVSVLNSDGSTAFSQSYTDYPDPSITVDAEGTSGQIIQVQLDGTGVLSLAEVEVYSEITEETIDPIINSYSDEQATNPASNLLDGNDADESRWSVDGMPQWVIIDYGENLSITGTRVSTYLDRAYQYTVEFSTDLTSWSTIVDRSSNSDTAQPISDDFTSLTARYARLTVDGADVYTGSWVSITEFEIIEGEAPSLNTITIQENETGFCAVDGSVDKNNAGFTGDGYANTTNVLGSGVDWEIDGSAGDYTFVWAYAATSNRPADLIIDGITVASDILFNTTDAWTTWTTSSSTIVSLAAGVKTVRLQATTSDGLANIDYMDVTGSGAVASDCISSLELKSSPTELSNTENEDKFNVYPNPVSDILNVECAGSESATMSIINNIGQIVLLSDIQGGSTSIDISALHSGFYVVRVSNSQENYTKNIIKK